MTPLVPTGTRISIVNIDVDGPPGLTKSLEALAEQSERHDAEVIVVSRAGSGLTGPNGPAYRTKVKCLRICTQGPVALVYPEGAWYRHVTPENAERIIQEHVIGGRVVDELCFARNPLFVAEQEPDKL